MFRKFMSLMCAVLILATCVSYASAENATYLTAAQLYAQGVQEYHFKSGELKAQDEPLTVTFGRAIDLNADNWLRMAEQGEPLTNNRWIQYYREALNVDCVYELTSSSGGDYDTQLLLAMSSGTLPDIFLVETLLK